MAYRLDSELAEIARLAPRIDLHDVPAARASMAALTRQLRQSGPAPADARVAVEDRRVPGPAGMNALPLRIYRPSAAGGPRPVLSYFHGGAFCMGDLDTEHARCVAICAELGIVVVAADYRLAPEHPFPAGFEDCYAALVWASQHLSELAGDARRLAVGGSSAGGALAAAVALMARDRGDPPIAFQLLIYPVLDDRLDSPSMRAFGDTPIWDRPGSELMWRHYLGGGRSEVSPYAAPARAADLAGLPSAYVMTAEFDPLRDEGIDYARRLLAAGVPTELHNYPGAFHGFDAMGAGALSRAALAEQHAALRRALLPG